MRRIITLVLLYSTMQLVILLGSRGHGGQTLLVFGFLILGAYTIGEFAVALRLPRIVGYLSAGILFGPSVLGTVSVRAVADLEPVSSLAIALIAFLAGAELRWDEVRGRGIAILKIVSVELLVTLIAIATTLFVLRDWVPFLTGSSLRESIALAVLFATMAVVHSPAVTMAVLSETHANGPVARTTLGVVLVSDVVVVLLFSAALALARALVPPTAGGGVVSPGGVIWEILGAVVVGGALGGVIAAYLRLGRHELFLFAILATLFGAEVARLLHVEPLLTLLVAGFVTENVSRRPDGAALREAMERSAAPVFVVFFALAGAGIALPALAQMWPLVIPLVVVRAAAIWGGTRIGARWARVTELEARYTWMGLISQAGVAVGLAVILASVYPSRGAAMQTLFLAALAVYELTGPILFRRALQRSGELATAADESSGQGAEGDPPRELATPS